MIFTLKKFKRDAWSGHTRFSNTFIQLTPEIGRDGYPVTGLSEEDARRLEGRLFMKPGELDKRNEAYWGDKFKIAFPEGGLILNDEDPEHELYLSVLKVMKKVANGHADLKKKSKAEYMLVSAELVEAEDDDRLSVKETAYGLLSESSEDRQKQLYVVLLASKNKGAQIVDVSTMTQKAIKNGLRQAIESTPKVFIEIASDPKLNLKYTILDLVTKRVLATSNGGYFFNNEPIGGDLDEAVKYMENPHHQGQVIKFNQLAGGKKLTRKELKELEDND